MASRVFKDIFTERKFLRRNCQNSSVPGGIAEGYVVAQTACSDKEYVEGLEMKVVALIYVIASLIIISFISGFNPNIISKSFYVHLPRTVSLYL